MRTKNVEISFRINIPVDEPDGNGNIYTKEAIKKAYKNIEFLPIEITNENNEFIPIGVAQDIELIEDTTGMYVKGSGLIWHGGTEEDTMSTNGKITDFRICGIGFAKE